jgi:hypothetical protein
LLLFPKSRVVGRDVAYNNVVRGILDPYLLDDRGLWKGSGHRVPRFLSGISRFRAVVATLPRARQKNVLRLPGSARVRRLRAKRDHFPGRRFWSFNGALATIRRGGGLRTAY